MGKIVKPNNPCLNPKCKSSDARQIYEDGTSFCFSCSQFFKADGNIQGISERETVVDKQRKETLEEIKDLPIKAINDRKISKSICEFFGVKVSVDEDGLIDAHFYPYGETEITGYKRRKLPKEFNWIGEAGKLFGRQLFPGGGKRLIIVEGEIDALSVAQASFNKYNKVYPVVALPGATNHKGIVKYRDWIRSYGEVILFLDADEAGETALNAIAKIIGFDKIKIAKPPGDCKDANDVLRQHGHDRLLECIWDATKYSPAGIIFKEELWEALVKYNDIESLPYPSAINGLNLKLKGMRLGEIALFVSGTSSGKSTMLREIMLSLVEQGNKIGVISLEESPAETARKLSGMSLNLNPADEEIPLDRLKSGFDNVFGNDNIILLDHQGSIRDSSILDQLEYMCIMGCKYLFVDHITILVSEGAEGLTGNEAIDKVMNDLLRLIKRHNVWIGLVSHLRKTQVGGKSFEEGKMPSLDDIKGCLAFNTQVLLASGKSIAVQDVKPGDRLMGDDNDHKEVLELFNGEQQMYKVTTKITNDYFICNSDHILTLSYNDKKLDISIADFLEKSESFKKRCKQHYSTGYELPERQLIIPPYSFGAWLGDGSKSAFRIMDAGKLGIVERVAEEIKATLITPNDINREYFNFNTGIRGDMLSRLKRLNVYCNKHIPEDYIFNTKKVRYELLAGLIDTDGYYNVKDNCYYFYQKDENIAKVVKQIARSLGLYSNIRSQKISSNYTSNGTDIFVVTISGNIALIPAQKKFKLTDKARKNDPLKRGIVIEKLGIAPYYGFRLNGNGRFLLANHTITHNSGSIKQVSFDIVGFARNMLAENEIERNTIKMRVLKCRYTGLTGSVPGAVYDFKTGRLRGLDNLPQDEFVSLE